MPFCITLRPQIHNDVRTKLRGALSARSSVHLNSLLPHNQSICNTTTILAVNQNWRDHTNRRTSLPEHSSQSSNNNNKINRNAWSLSSSQHKRDINTNTPPPPTKGQDQHNTLKEFLSYTQRTSLSEKSTTYQGTLYEYLVQTHLNNNLNFHLTRVGGKNDSGIDLLGKWHLHHHRQHLPHQYQHPPPIPILIQCKRISKPTPSLMRELEGSFLAAPATYRQSSDPSCLGIMVCTRPATKGIRAAMARSRRGLAWITMEVIEEHDDDGDDQDVDVEPREQNLCNVPRTKIRQLLWNRAASELCGLAGFDVGLSHVDGHAENAEIQLLWKGLPLEFVKIDRAGTNDA